MPIIKIFKGNIADQLYSEQNIIKTKSKDLQIKKQQMEICKRDMEKITLSESLVQVAKNQVYALTQISAFMDFVNSSDNQNSEITELYNTINPNYDSDDTETNLFAQFDYVLTNKENNEYKNDDSEVLSLKEWYPYLYQKSYSDYYALYSEISVHQINIHKIANDAIGTVDLRHNEVDIVMAIAKNISNSVNKLVDFASEYFGSNTEKINNIVNEVGAQEQLMCSRYMRNIDEDYEIVPVTFDVSCDLAVGNTITIGFDEVAKIVVSTNVPGTFELDEQHYVYIDGVKRETATITVNSTGVTHEFVIKNTNDSLSSNVIYDIFATFTPTDEENYQVYNYNILSTNGDEIDITRSNMLFNVNLKPIEIKTLTSISWKDSVCQYSAAYPERQHYMLNCNYESSDGKLKTGVIEAPKSQIEAFAHSNEDSTYSYIQSSYASNKITDFYTSIGQYDLYYTLNSKRTDQPMVVTII